MKKINAELETILNTFPLIAHPEGGSYLESYRSVVKTGDRSASTAIYFLLKAEEFSAFHRIKSDEMWHFYLGGPLRITEIDPAGEMHETILGNDLTKFHKLQYVVKAGHWFASQPLKATDFSFVGCTVAPGFEFSDFELADRQKLIQEFPKSRAVIESLTSFQR